MAASKGIIAILGSLGLQALPAAFPLDPLAVHQTTLSNNILQPAMGELVFSRQPKRSNKHEVFPARSPRVCSRSPYKTPDQIQWKPYVYVTFLRRMFPCRGLAVRVSAGAEETMTTLPDEQNSAQPWKKHLRCKVLGSLMKRLSALYQEPTSYINIMFFSPGPLTGGILL